MLKNYVEYSCTLERHIPEIHYHISLLLEDRRKLSDFIYQLPEQTKFHSWTETHLSFIAKGIPLIKCYFGILNLILHLNNFCIKNQFCLKVRIHLF